MTWRGWTFCWDNSQGTPSTHASCACGIVGRLLSITQRKTGLCGRNWCFAEQGKSSTTLWWRETGYSSPRCTSSSVWLSSSPKLWTSMAAASLICARLFQDWPWKSWKLASLTVLKSVNSSAIQSLKTQWTKWNWKLGRLLFWSWRTFLATRRPVCYSNCSNLFL